MTVADDTAAVVIGRNEGARLRRCLESLSGQTERVVYVDSGSSDDSVQMARELGAEVVELDPNRPFTAARARNTGLAALDRASPDFVQFVDGDCEVREDWISAARGFLLANPDAAVACGRRRERYPEASVYNRLIDREWDTPAGESKACGGDALMRWTALDQAGGYDPDLIAGEEPELCLRLRRLGWSIWRLDKEMTWHDADMRRFGQWWMRARRAGHSYAEGAAMYGRAPERHKVRELASALLWGAVLPTTILLAGVFWAAALVLFVVYPLQILRLVVKGYDLMQAAFLVLSKLPEAAGALGYAWQRFRGRSSGLIEYK